MFCVCINLRATCHSCGQPVPINALAPRVACPSCQHPLEIPAEHWKMLLADAAKEGPGMEILHGRSTSLLTGGAQYYLEWAHANLYCFDCKTDYAEVAPESGETACANCGKRVGIRAVEGPAPFRWAVREDATQLPATSGAPAVTAPAKAAEPIFFPCPRCAASLPVDGSDRVVKCTYCQAQLFLPDALWFRLHPPKLVERWFVLAD